MPQLSDLSLPQILNVTNNPSLSDIPIDSLRRDMHCLNYLCPVCHVNALQIVDNIESILTSNSELYGIQMIYLAQKAVKLYGEHIEAEIKSNEGRQLIKMIYIVGISLSVVATGYLLDKNIRKQLKKNEEEERQEKLLKDKKKK